ncbi:ABC transporter substrate-binding protein [Abyssisolibacter fermentans]|uniref:ABC transporter substrate-binding protein n=1 Tax=Abyssisolibacter fermentans TaxID=1766203 RepID=UPI0008325066|nr:ABC transporter substrate-binding protein [Abyssisolibacter fermentans]
MKKRILALIISMVMLSTLMLAGCGSETTGSKDSSEKPKTLIYARGADSTALDPAYVSDGESAKVIVNIYEGLVRYKDGSTEIEPALATDWKVSDDGKEYVFNLRKDVKFHDGTPFNADAVVFSVERQLPPNRTSDMPYASFTYGEVEKVEKVDEYTVKFTLKDKYTPFLANMAMALAAPIACPNGKDLSSNPIGTGPFKFVKWDKGQAITLEKNEDYWGEKAKVDKVIFKITKENSVRASELIAGSVDIIDGVAPNDVKQLEDNKLNVLKQNGMNINYMAFNCSREPFNDPKLREALSHAIDREELVKYLYQGYSELASSYMPSFIPGYNDAVKPYEYDTEKAKQMLKELGKEDLEVKMICYSNPRPYNPVGQKLAEAVQNYLSQVGVKATIDVYPWKEYKQKATQGEGDILFFGWIGDNGDADNFLSLLDSKEISSSLNSAMYSSEEIDELLAEAKTMTNGEERNKVYEKVQEILTKDAPWLPISHATDMAAYTNDIKGFKLHPTGVVFLNTIDKE